MHNVAASQDEHVRQHLPVDITLETRFNQPQKLSHSNELVHSRTFSKLLKGVFQVDIDELFRYSFFDVERVGY